MAQIGNKQNAYLNGQWGRHVRDMKKETSGVRRQKNKQVVRSELSDYLTYDCGEWYEGSNIRTEAMFDPVYYPDGAAVYLSL